MLISRRALTTPSPVAARPSTPARHRRPRKPRRAAWDRDARRCSDERDVTMKPGHWIAPLVVLVALSAAVAPLDRVRAATAEAVDHTALRVCADPNNLPFSNDKGEGFENKIAEVLAAELGVPVRYTWYPDSVGFVRNTLRARACDLIVGTTAGGELLQNTNPYYRSSFSLVYRKEAGLTLASLDDPALQTLQL